MSDKRHDRGKKWICEVQRTNREKGKKGSTGKGVYIFKLGLTIESYYFHGAMLQNLLLEWYSRTSENDNKGLKPQNQGFAMSLQDQKNKPHLSARQKREKNKFYSLQSTGSIRSPTGQQLHVFQVHSALWVLI